MNRLFGSSSRLLVALGKAILAAVVTAIIVVDVAVIAAALWLLILALA